MTLHTPLSAPECGCDAQAIAGNLLSLDVARARLHTSVTPLDRSETLPLSALMGRILAAPAIATALTPPFDNSAMDGYALNTATLTGAGPWTLPVQTCILAGHSADTAQHPGHAAQIFTGAPLPKGADTVVMQEQITRSGDQITLTSAPKPGAHIRRAGEDLRPGQTVLPIGTRLTPRSIAALAAAGIGAAPVAAAPRVALLTTGDEVTPAGQPLPPAGIWDVNTPMLHAAITASGARLTQHIHAADTRAGLRTALQALAGTVDLIVTTGGISVGDADFVKPALADLGGTLTFSGVALKPGKPVSLGTLGGTHWLGLPGNPVSALVTWALFGAPLIDRLTGARTPTQAPRTVCTPHALHHRPGRCEARPATLSGHDALGRATVTCTGETRSAHTTTLAAADGLILLPAEADIIPAGDLLDFIPIP